LVGVSTMLALTAALRSGMDVQGVLEGWGFGAALAGETAASLAAGYELARTRPLAAALPAGKLKYANANAYSAYSISACVRAGR
jgi:hypothetical protein